MELFGVISLLISGVFIVLNRTIKNIVKTKKIDSLISKAEKNNSFLNDLIESNDCTYKYFAASGINIEKTKEVIQNISLSNYKVLKVLTSQNGLLIYNNSSYTSWDTGINGKAMDVSKTTQDLFVIKYDNLNAKVLISGPMHNNAEEKFVYQEFANVLNLCIRY